MTKAHWRTYLNNLPAQVRLDKPRRESGLVKKNGMITGFSSAPSPARATSKSNLNFKSKIFVIDKGAVPNVRKQHDKMQME